MATHAVGHQKDVTPLPPLIRVRGQEHGRRILIMAAANPDVGQCGMFNLIVPGHSAASQFHPFLYATRAMQVCKGADDACPLPLKLPVFIRPRSMLMPSSSFCSDALFCCPKGREPCHFANL